MFEKFFSVVEAFIGRLGLTAVAGAGAAATAGLVTKKVTEEGAVSLNPLAIAGAGVAGVAIVEGVRFFATDAEALRAEILRLHGIDVAAVDIAMKRHENLSAVVTSAEARLEARIEEVNAQLSRQGERQGELLRRVAAGDGERAKILDALAALAAATATAEQAAAAPAAAAVAAAPAKANAKSA